MGGNEFSDEVTTETQQQTGNSSTESTGSVGETTTAQNPDTNQPTSSNESVSDNTDQQQQQKQQPRVNSAEDEANNSDGNMSIDENTVLSENPDQSMESQEERDSGVGGEINHSSESQSKVMEHIEIEQVTNNKSGDNTLKSESGLAGDVHQQLRTDVSASDDSSTPSLDTSCPPPLVATETSTESKSSMHEEQINPIEPIKTPDPVKSPVQCVDDSPFPSLTGGSYPGQVSESIYHLKWFEWKGIQTPIITQNENGPCPLLAIANVLILARKIEFPPMQQIISGKQLMEYIGKN